MCTVDLCCNVFVVHNFLSAKLVYLRRDTAKAQACQEAHIASQKLAGSRNAPYAPLERKQKFLVFNIFCPLNVAVGSLERREAGGIASRGGTHQ